jgi:hypothetical protein
LVDKTDCLAGDFARARERVMLVVAETAGIVGFLPQAHLGRLEVGDTFWGSPAHDRHAVHETSVTKISSRIDSLLDASIPLLNQRRYGRNMVGRFPLSAGGGPPLLSPGQSVTTATSRPGGNPVLPVPA